MPNSIRTSLLALSLLWGTSCGGSGGPSDGTGNASSSGGRGSIAFELTDAPIDPRLVEEAVIEVDAISVHQKAEAKAGFVTVFDGRRPLVVNLLNLRNGTTAPLEAGFLEPGSYRQGRILITDAHLKLTNGKEYSTRAGTLDLTNQDASGYKVFFDPPVEVREGVETRVLLDFELLKTFSPIPANDLENARAFHLHPLVRFAVLQETGELRGVVLSGEEAGAVPPAAGAMVYVLDPGERDPDRAVASTLTDASGSAAILGLRAGTYDVLAVLDVRSGRAEGLAVAVGSVTSFEIRLEPPHKPSP